MSAALHTTAFMGIGRRLHMLLTKRFQAVLRAHKRVYLPPAAQWPLHQRAFCRLLPPLLFYFLHVILFFFRLNPILIGLATADFSPSACRFGKVLRRIPLLTQPFLFASYDTQAGAGARWMNFSTPIHIMR